MDLNELANLNEAQTAFLAGYLFGMIDRDGYVSTEEVRRPLRVVNPWGTE